jgi:hypothetical protein
MSFGRFLLIDGLGALLWVGVFVGLGMLFSQSLAWLAARLAATGTWMFLILGAGLGGYIAWKWVARRRFLRQLRIARVTPEDLKEKLDKPVLIVDLRSDVDFSAEAHAPAEGAAARAPALGWHPAMEGAGLPPAADADRYPGGRRLIAIRGGVLAVSVGSPRKVRRLLPGLTNSRWAGINSRLFQILRIQFKLGYQ